MESMERLAHALSELGCFHEAASEGPRSELSIVVTLLGMLVVDVLGSTTEAEFADRLCKSLFSNTRSVTGLRVATDRLIKIFGRRSKFVKTYQADGLMVEAHFERLDARDELFLSSAIVIAHAQLRNVRKFQELHSLALYDPLTGALSRRAGLDLIEWELSRGLRYGRRAQLVFLDIDDFKSYNDRFGHLAGDKLLAEFVSVVRRNICAGDAVIRYGGDEFLLILYTDEPDAVLSRILESSPVTFSYGVASFSETNEVAELIALADRRMYIAKELKRRLKDLRT